MNELIEKFGRGQTALERAAAWQAIQEHPLWWPFCKYCKLEHGEYPPTNPPAAGTHWLNLARLRCFATAQTQIAAGDHLQRMRP